MFGKRGVLRVVAGMAVLAVMMSGCTPEAATPDAVPNPALEALLASAHRDGAAPEAIATLELALAEGRNVTFEEYQSATELGFECLRDLGLQVLDITQGDRYGLIEIEYSYGGGEPRQAR